MTLYDYANATHQSRSTASKHPQHLGIMLLEQLLIKDTLATPKLLAFGKV